MMKLLQTPRCRAVIDLFPRERHPVAWYYEQDFDFSSFPQCRDLAILYCEPVIATHCARPLFVVFVLHLPCVYQRGNRLIVQNCYARVLAPSFFSQLSYRSTALYLESPCAF